MNAFFEHHKDSIRFGYRCFDRILLNGLIQPFQQPERVVGFFNSYRQVYPVSRDVLRGAAEQFQSSVKEQAANGIMLQLSRAEEPARRICRALFQGRQARSGRRRVWPITARGAVN
jgi:hypothetical protein